ncbi:MAG: pantetheine-phosphate adenylyltransferase [Nitrospirae bacterium]|nr:pantetheine-phosphate adenylyltransferase [Nitrospirota bacterium]
MKKIAIYPGTFDPITNGHIDIAKRSVRLFDKLIVAVLNNPKKTPLFTVNERVELIREVLKDEVTIEVDYFNGLLVDYANKKQGCAIIRGLRAISDFEYEMQMSLINRRLNPNIDTFFKMPSEEYTFLTSSAVKEIASLGGSVAGLVPRVVEKALKDKFKHISVIQFEV